RKPKPQASSTKPKQLCYCCGGNHQQSTCRFRHESCHGCGKIGHLMRVCKTTSRTAQTQYITDTVLEAEQEKESLELFTVYTTQIGLGDKPVSMQLDTGASVLLVPEHIYKSCLSKCPLQPSLIQLTSYIGDQIPVLGEIQTPVTYEGRAWTLPLVVVQGNRPALLGRNWLDKIKLNWDKIFTLCAKTVASQDAVSKVLDKHDPLFQEGYGTITDFKAKIQVKKGATPIFHKPRPISYALKEPVEKELYCLERHSIISPIKRSNWAAPIVVVPKKDKSVRLCGEDKVTVNSCVEPEPYPLPNAKDLFATLAGRKFFIKLDLSFAHQQLELEPGSEPFLTINIQKGLYRYHQLTYGVSTVPAIFQNTMDQILHSLDRAVCCMDDILVTAPTIEEHLATLDQVMSRLQQYGVRVKRAKCQFLQDSVGYLGYQTDPGAAPTEGKVAAIVNAPAPKNVMELQSFLGLLNYYGRFLANLSTLLQPLHDLLQKDAKWNWSPQCEATFQTCKQLLLNSKWLAHYDPTKPLRLACDVSPYGVDHVLPSGEEHPIAFASRILSPSERNYAQIEREALSIIFGVKKFYKYFYGCKFTFLTDHKPLLVILRPKAAIQTLAALRMQRWALTL
uniref:ribonuclease H n=1 Tax=Latimeria chalumnae TaxID=7897 RepID=H2ZYF8_LATCH